jgi:hypothetical protein
MDVIREIWLSLASLGFVATIAFVGWQLGALAANLAYWWQNRS